MKILDTTGVTELINIIKNNFAKLNSPALTGTPTAPTPAANDDSTKIATTAFVQDAIDGMEPVNGITDSDIATAWGDVTPAENVPNTSGTISWNNVSNKPSFATVATSGDYEDLLNTPTIPEVPTNISTFTNDSNYATLASPAFTGTPTAPTPVANDNSTKIATTEFVNNYLPLSGGIMTGNVAFGLTDVITRSVDDSYISILGGSVYRKGAYLALSGKDRSGSSGIFELNADNGTTKITLFGTPNGTLTWNGQPIQTSSDKRLKQDFSDVPVDVLEAWGKVNWQQFKYKDDVKRKGDSCRFHTGLVAQDVKEVGEANNVDLLKYGILCHDVREATENSEAVDLWTVRYEEALAMEVIYLRNEIKKLREEIKALRTE